MQVNKVLPSTTKLLLLVAAMIQKKTG